MDLDINVWLTDILSELWLFIKDLFTIKGQQSMANTISLPPFEAKLLALAKSNLGNHLTLDPNVPPEVGCSEALSKILQMAGVTLPAEGIAGTNIMLQFLIGDTQFSEIQTPDAGAIIISATGTGNGKIPGHCGIVGAYGICSNDSNSGLWLELWDLAKWETYYEDYGNMRARFFVLK